MQTLGILSMTTKLGHTSTWEFGQFNGSYYLIGGCHDTPPKKFKTIQELRDLYRSYLSYGYTPMDKQRSTLPRNLQLELWSLPALV